MPLLTHNSRSRVQNSRTILSIDPDTYKFIYANGMTDPAQINAVNYLVTDLKRIGVWSKMKALYPFAGGTATTHKYNLKDPRDLDAAYRIAFAGGLTHSSNGILPDGASGHGNTYFNPSVVFSDSLFGHLAFYSRTDGDTATRYSIGGTVNGGGNFSMHLKVGGTSVFVGDRPGVSYRVAQGANTVSQGLFVGTQQTTNIKVFKNGNLVGSNTSVAIDRLLANSYVGLFSLYQSGSPAYYDHKECAYASIGDALTDLEITNLYAVVQQYQTLLGRQV